MKKIFVITGEASGDQHAAACIAEIRKSKDVLVKAVGGDALQDVGADIFMRYDDLAVMGFWEVMKNARKFKAIINSIVNEICAFHPDILLLVDSSGLNMRIAKKVKQKLNIKIHYYIAPKIWAWGEWRIKAINKSIDYLYCILPFEEDYFRSKGFNNVFYVGNPTLRAISTYDFRPIDKLKEIEKPILALLPGSRKQEIDKILPIMLAAGKKADSFQLVLACSPGLTEDYYDKYLEGYNVIKVKSQTWDLLHLANKAIVTSGTATLETALIGCPQIVCYKTSGISYALGKRLIKVKFISLVNLILNKKAVVELIQHECNSTSLYNESKIANKEDAIDIKLQLKQKLDIIDSQDLESHLVNYL